MSSDQLSLSALATYRRARYHRLVRFGDTDRSVVPVSLRSSMVEEGNHEDRGMLP
jgi:hypothetical protein